MSVRKAKAEDIQNIIRVIEIARGFMRSTGNSFQWGEKDYPGDKVPGDIEREVGYVVEDGDRIIGYFAFIIGEDPTYNYIAGEWIENTLPYGAIHRVASDGSRHGLLEEILDFAFGVIDNIRIDTHEANAPMRHKLEKNGFTYCGTIYVSDGSPRRAYQKVISGGDYVLS